MLTTQTKIKALKALLLSTALLFTNIGYSAETNVAEEYMKAYATFDTSKLVKFYSKDAKFRDPTSEIWGEYAWNIDGRKKIIETMDTYFSKFDSASVDYNAATKYASAGHNVYTGKAKFTKVNKDKTIETRCVSITTVVSIKNGKVVEHRDYLDYDNWDTSKKSVDQSC